MSRTHDIEGALRTLDAADHASSPLEPPAPSHLLRSASPVPHDPPVQRTRRARAFGLASAVLAAVTVGVVALPSLSGGDQAFASWTPDPDAVPRLEQERAAEDCRRCSTTAPATPPPC